MVEVNKLKEK